MSDVTEHQRLQDPGAISLYLDLEPNQNPDLRLVAAAAIAWANALYEITAELDPSLDIRIELISSNEGSLSINSILRTLKPENWLTKKNIFMCLF